MTIETGRERVNETSQSQMLLIRVSINFIWRSLDNMFSQ
jgi:hypothetical protein